MSQPIELLDRVEGEVSALLVAGLATRRSNKDRLEGLAGEVSALKLERLAAELRKVAGEGDPASLAGGVFTTLAMARKIRERLAPWSKPEPGPSLAMAYEPALRVAVAEEPPESPDLPTLMRWMESGDELLRAHAATLLVQRGEEAVPELARLARKGPVAVRREAICLLGRIGGEAAVGVLIDLVGDLDCWRALLPALRPHGRETALALAGLLEPKGAKKGPDPRRGMAAALLHRLGVRSQLDGWWQDEDPVVRGFALGSCMRTPPKPEDVRAMAEALQAEKSFLVPGIVALAQAEFTGELDQVIEAFEMGALNEVRAVARWAGCGSPLEEKLAEHYLGLLTAPQARTRQRAASVLRGIACPAAVLPLASMVAAGEGDLADLLEILGEVGGSHAAGILLDLATERGAVDAALAALKQVGDPGTAPALVEMLVSAARPTAAEAALVALGDGAMDLLAREMRVREGDPSAGRIQGVLLQINTPRAREALRDTGSDSVESLLSRLGHPKLGVAAAKALAKHGEAVLDPLEKILAGSDRESVVHAVNAVASIPGERAHEIVYGFADRNIATAPSGWRSPPNPWVITLLARRGEERSHVLLARALASDNFYLRDEAARALVKLGPSVAPLLIPLLDDPQAQARAAAIEVLGQLGIVDVEQKGIELLSDGDTRVRHAAERALGMLGVITHNPAVAVALGILLDRLPNSSFSQLANKYIDALAGIGCREGIPYLRRFVDRPRSSGFSQGIREQALQAIQKIEAANTNQPGQGLAGKLRRLLGGN